MAGASGNHLLYQQTFQPADNLYFRLQEGLQRARYGDFMAALVLHTTVILEQANVLRELVQDSRALYNKVIENTQAVKGLEAKTAAIERQIIEQNLHLRDMPPCQPTSYNTYPAMGEQQVHVMCAREQPRSRGDQPPLVSLARMTHSQQHMEEAYQRQTMINRPPSRSQTSYPPPPPPLVPHPSSNSYSFLNSGNYPSHRPYGNVSQPPRLYPIPSNRAQQPPSGNVRYPVHSLSRLPPPAILPPPESYRPLPVTSQSITISTVITTTASSSSSSTTTASPSSLSSPSESTVLPNLVLPAGITIIPLGPVTSSSAESSHTNQQFRRESPIRNVRPSVVIQPIPDESDKANAFERDSPNDLSRRKRRLMPVEMNTLRVLRRFAEGEDESDFSRELLPYDNQMQRTLPEVDLVPLKQVPLQTPDETIVTPGILQHAHLVQTSLVSTTSSRMDSDVAPPIIKKASQNKGLNLECLLQRIAEYTQNKPAPEAPPLAPDKNSVTPLSVGSRRRKSLTKLTRDKIRQHSARTPEATDPIEELGVPTCENVFQNSENVIDAGIPIIVSVEGSVDVNKFLDESNEESHIIDNQSDKNAISSSDNAERNVLSIETVEADMEVSSIINEFKSIAISPQSEKCLRKNPIIVLSRCDQAPPNKLSARLRATAKVKSMGDKKQTTGRATPPHDLDSAVTEIVTELVSYIEMRNTGSPAPVESTEPTESVPLPTVTEDISSNSSSLPPKSMTIQHFDVFCVTRDNILKVHNNDFSSAELPQVPTSNRLSSDAENNTTRVVMPTKFPAIMEVPEPECERSCQEKTKSMQETEPVPTTTCSVLQAPSVDNVDINTASSSTNDTQKADVSSIIVTSVSSIMDEAFRSPSTPQDYAAKLLAKLKTIIPDIRVTPITTNSNAVSREVKQYPPDDVITIQCTSEHTASPAARMVTIREAESIASSDNTTLVEESFLKDARNNVVSTTESVVAADAKTATQEIPRVGSIVGSDSAEDIKNTVYKVVNKIMRTVAARVTDSNNSHVASIDTVTENLVVKDKVTASAVDESGMLVVMNNTVGPELSDAGVPETSHSDIDTVVAAVIKDISDNVVINMTESVQLTTLNVINILGNVVSSGINVASDSTASAVPDEIATASPIENETDAPSENHSSSVISVENVDGMVNSVLSVAETNIPVEEAQLLESVNEETKSDTERNSIEVGGSDSEKTSIPIEEAQLLESVNEETKSDTERNSIEVGGSDSEKTSIPVEEAQLLESVNEETKSDTERNSIEVGGSDSENTIITQTQSTPSPTLMESQVSESKLEKAAEISPVDHVIKSKILAPCQNVDDSINSSEKLAQSVPVVRRVKLVRPMYSISSGSKTSRFEGNDNQNKRLISVITARPPKDVTSDLRITPHKPHSPVQFTKASSDDTRQPSQQPEQEACQKLQQTVDVNVSAMTTVICKRYSPDVTSPELATAPVVELLSTGNNTSPSDEEIGSILPTVAQQNKDPTSSVSILSLTPELPCMLQPCVEMNNEQKGNNSSIMVEPLDECITESVMKPIIQTCDKSPEMPNVPYLDTETVEKIVGDLVSIVSLDTECPVPTVVEPTAAVSAAANLIETLPITCVQPSTPETATKQRLPARKPKLNLWGASGYRTRKKRRKARVKPETLAAVATADKSVIASIATDVSQQLKKKRATAKPTRLEPKKCDSTAGSSDVINNESGVSLRQSYEKGGTISKTSGSTGGSAISRSSVYLGVTVEGQAEVELRTSSKGRVSLFKVVTRDRKARKSRSTEKAQMQKEPRKLLSSRKKREVESSEKLSSIFDETAPAIFKTKGKTALLCEEMEPRIPFVKQDKPSTPVAEVSSTNLAVKNLTQTTAEDIEPVTKRKRGRPKDSTKSPKSKKTSSNMLKISQETLTKPCHMSETVGSPNSEPHLRLEATEDNRTYRVVRSGALLTESVADVSDKPQQSQTKRLESILVTTRIPGAQDNDVLKDGGISESSYSASCTAVPRRGDSDGSKVGEDGSYTGALRLVIKGPGISRSLQEHRMDGSKKSVKLHRKTSQPKDSSKNEAKLTLPQVSTDAAGSSEFADNSNLHSVSNNSSLTSFPNIASSSLTSTSENSQAHVQEVSKRVKETTNKTIQSKTNSREGADLSSSCTLEGSGEQINETITSSGQAEFAHGQHTEATLLPVSSTIDSVSSKRLVESTNKTKPKPRKKSLPGKSETKTRLKVILPQVPSSVTAGQKDCETHSGQILPGSDKNTLPVISSETTDAGAQTRIVRSTVTPTKTRRKVVLSTVNSLEKVRHILPKPSNTVTAAEQNNGTLLCQEQKRDHTEHEDTDALPVANPTVISSLEQTKLREDSSSTPKTRKKHAQTKAISKSRAKVLVTDLSSNVPSDVANHCSSVDNQSPVDTRTVSNSAEDDVPESELHTKSTSVLDKLQLERAKLQEAVKKATTKTRRKIAQLRTTGGESAKSFAVLPASMSVNVESRTSVGESGGDIPSEISQSLDRNVQINEASTKDVPLHTPSCSQVQTLDDDIIEVISARVRTLESGDPDYAIISLLQELIEGNDPNVVPIVESASADNDSTDSVGAKTLTRAIRIWQEHDYSRFPIEVLKLSENEQEASQSQSATLSSRLNAGDDPCSRHDEGAMDVEESSRMTVARSAIEKLVDVDARHKAGEETQPPSSIANTLRKLLTRVQDQSISNVSTLDNSLEDDKNKTVSTSEMVAKSSCSECASGPSGVKCNHVISVSAASASRLLSLLTRASHKAKKPQTNIAVGHVQGSDAATSSHNSELNISRDEDTGDESSNSGQALNFKQLLQNRLQNKLKIESPASDSSDVETDDRYKTLLKTFINKKTVITEKNACYVTPERNLNIKTLKHRLSFAIAGGVSTTNSSEEHEETFALQPQVQCVNIFSIHEIWKYLKCFINDSSRASLSLHQLGQKEMQQFLVLAKLCCLSAHKDETDLIFEKTEQTQDLTVDMLEEAIKLLEEGNVE